MSKSQLQLNLGVLTAVDDMAAVPPSVVNFQIDAAGINRMRPGLVSYPTTGLGSSALIGLYVWTVYLIAVTADRKIWALPEASPTTWLALSDGTAATQLDGGHRPVFAEDGSRVVIAGGGAIEKWEGVGLAARLGGGPNATHVASLGGRFIANNSSFPNEFDWSQLGDGVHSLWDALAIDEADARPDPIAAIYENLRELHVFGTTTTQIYSVGIDPFAPFDNTTATNIGTSAPYSIVRMDEHFAFLDDKRRFVLSNGRTNTPISDVIQKDLRTLSTVTDCWGYREDFEQFNNIVWTFPTAGRTFVFDTARNIWTERKFYSAPFQINMPQACYAYWKALNAHLLGSSATAALYRLDSDTRADLGGPMICERYTGWEDCGTRGYKRDEYLAVVLRRGTSTLGGTEAAFEVRCRDDGGIWSDFDFILLGQPADVEQTIRVRLGGCFYRRQWHFRYSGSDDFSLVSAEQSFEDLDAEEEAA